MTKRAVLLVNLGSPAAPHTQPVREYLNQFLMDPYVIQLPWLLRRMIVSLFVLPKRPAASAKAYASIWGENGSPLITLSQDLQEKLQQQLDMPVGLAMRYGQPSIESQILELAAKPGVEEILFIPLYPHYADSTVTTSVAEARRVIATHKLTVRLNVLAPFYQQPDYIDSLYECSRDYLQANNYDHVVFSYHGLPESHLQKADPTGSHCLKQTDCCNTPSSAHDFCYRHQVMRTTQLLVERAGLMPQQYSVAFQSRLGKAKWLDPSTRHTLEKLAAQGIKRVVVLCPAFVTDCLETLEEIAIQGKEEFLAAGGESLQLIPCLNSHPRWVETLADWCRHGVEQQKIVAPI